MLALLLCSTSLVPVIDAGPEPKLSDLLPKKTQLKTKLKNKRKIEFKNKLIVLFSSALLAAIPLKYSSHPMFTTCEGEHSMETSASVGIISALFVEMQWGIRDLGLLKQWQNNVTTIMASALSLMCAHHTWYCWGQS